MQMLFAYKQRVQANQMLSEDYISGVFSPDLNSMEVQDPVVLKQKKEASLEVFHDKLNDQAFKPSKGDELEEAAAQAIDTFHKSNREDLRQIRKQMESDVDHLYGSYISFLELILELHALAELDTRRNHSNFVKNLLIKGLRLNKTLEKTILDIGFGWQGRPDVKEWLKSLIAKDPEYQAYNEKKDPGFEEDHEILKHLVSKIIFRNEVIETFLEENDLHWAENRPVIKSLILKTLKSIEDGEPGAFSLQQVSYNYEEDKEFFIRLYDSTAELTDELKAIIAEKALNWDIERLALTDRVILEMAIAELTNFTSIPVKVTINEYIEISKKYSTPKSKQFINGLLDAVATELKNNGHVRKSGRGLIDNK